MTGIQRNLLQWYKSSQRPLPWRLSRDPYRIWVSEVMLQQTTVTAVIPYFNRFIERFPNVGALAQAQENEIYPYWAGLGYYNRAKNLWRAAQLLAHTGFPKTYLELLELPGFGPYTARAVSSLAFEEAVGVVDGNVIRVLSRLLGLDTQWWKTSGRAQIQEQADRLVQGVSSHEMNQALMELGATICTPKSPLCVSCPWQKHCVALKKDFINELPLAKPRRQPEHWIWQPEPRYKGKRWGLVQNNYAPFLKGRWLWPGRAFQVEEPPRKYDFKHAITHHQIYVQVAPSKESQKTERLKWIDIKSLPSLNPASLMKKTLDYLSD